MKYYFIFLLLLGSISAVAQDGAPLRVTGTIIDDQKNPIPFASVVLHHQADSSMVNGAVSDDFGKFHIDAIPGDYFIKISFLSFEEKNVKVPNVIDRDVDVGTIVLKSSARLLKEVEVTGEKSQMELQLDKRVFNVGKDLSNIGGTAADILGNLPSVNVDPDGAVSLRGSENVRILIDGRPSGLTSRDPDGLRKLQGNLVERVEIITNPSSRYDAAGEVGIINIIMKKNQQNGVNGSVTATVGYPEFYGGSYTLNLRRKNVNLFSNYGIDYRNRPGYGRSFQRFVNTDSSYSQNNDRTNSELSHNFMIGLDYFLTDKSTLTGSFLYNTGSGVTKSTTTYRDFKNDELVKTVFRTENEAEDEENVEGSLNYKQEFKRKDQTLTLDFKWIRDVDDEITDYTEGVEGDVPKSQDADNLANETTWLFQSDYIHPFSKEGKVEAGLKSNTRIIKNEFGLRELNAEGEWITFPAFTNNLVYTERIHAAYLMASNRFNKLSLQGGLRGEYSNITTELTVTDEVNNQNYFNLFPSASISYAVRENRTLQLSYSYRISRPEFRDLMPFSDFRDSRVFFMGNPTLRPEYTHSIEAGYLLDWENGSILSSIYHRNRKNVVQRVITDQDSVGRTRIVPVNMAFQKAYGLEFNGSVNIQHWWRLNSSVNFYRAITEGSYEGESLYSDTYTWTTRTTSRITIAKSWNFQTSFNYRAPRITPQGKDLSFSSVDLGLSKDVFKGKGTFTANVSDLFNTRKRRSIVDTDEYYSESTSQWRMRQFMFTFTYRINRDKERNEDRERDGEDEGGDY